MLAGVNETSLAQTNKEMRKELELLSKEARALSAIYWGLLQFMSEDQRDQIKSEVRKIVSSNFTQEEVNSYYKRNSDRAFRTTLEFDICEIIKPMKKE